MGRCSAAAVQASERLLDGLKAEMAQLLVSYTEDNPIVQKRKAYMDAVAATTEQLRQQAHSGSALDQIALVKFTIDETKKQMQRADEDAAAIDDVIAKLNDTIKAAESRNITASKLEVQYVSLKRRPCPEPVRFRLLYPLQPECP